MPPVFVQPDKMLTVGAYEYWSCIPPGSNTILALP